MSSDPMLSEIWQAWLLALIQGLSEFLPVSSSAHLILPAQVLNWSDQGLAFDVAVHVGTLLAVIAYFRKELLAMASDMLAWRSVRDIAASEVFTLAVATLPVVIVGLFAADTIEAHLRSVGVIAATTVLFGLVLGLADRSHRVRGEYLENITLGHALCIGCAQTLALIPGVSRSGITITCALFLGYTASAAARFSFLLAIPVIAGAMVFIAPDLWRESSNVTWGLSLWSAVLISAVTAYATIDAFLRWVARVGLMPFVYYRIGLGMLLLALIVLGVISV